MPNVNDLKSSRFLEKKDVMPDVLVTISGYLLMDVSMESQPEEMKWCLFFKEEGTIPAKPLVCNITNGELIAGIVHAERGLPRSTPDMTEEQEKETADNFDNWIGQEIVLYNDPTVSFGHRLTGGIRVRAKAPGLQKRQTFKEAEADVRAHAARQGNVPPLRNANEHTEAEQL